MTLTNFLLFLILVTLATYAFMPWKGLDKGSLKVSTVKMVSQWLIWLIIFGFLISLFIFMGINK